MQKKSEAIPEGVLFLVSDIGQGLWYVCVCAYRRMFLKREKPVST